ncbi:MAG TPA: TlpA family protein disulfide reductase, partial [Candidatus Acetothermia bacterium]|nr:TlpA family protein disulfide reductase [Candidatus Acetothermia bacterium]
MSWAWAERLNKGVTVKYLALSVLLVASVLSVQALATDFPIVGSQAPDFSLPDLSGATYPLSDYIGHPIVINFWTTWCGACTYEFPVLEQFKQEYADQVSLITICAGNSQDEARAAVEKKGVDFLVLYDEAEIISKAYQPPRPHDKRRIVAFPFSVFIDETGKVV